MSKLPVNLKRIHQPGGYTLGILTVEDFTCFTLERPWRNNKPYISCIPSGQYPMKRDKTGKHRCYRLEDEIVTPRSAIEIHVASNVDNLQGCIGLGYLFDFFSKHPLRHSALACDEFLEAMKDRDAILTIEDVK